MAAVVVVSVDHRPIEKLSAHLAPLFTFPPPRAAHTSLSPGTKMFVIQQKACMWGCAGLCWGECGEVS